MTPAQIADCIAWAMVINRPAPDTFDPTWDFAVMTGNPEHLLRCRFHASFGQRPPNEAHMLEVARMRAEDRAADPEFVASVAGWLA